jgi:hypothetical protein
MNTFQVYAALWRLGVQLKPAPIDVDVKFLRQSDQTGPFGNVAERSDKVRIEPHCETHLYHILVTYLPSAHTDW